MREVQKEAVAGLGQFHFQERSPAPVRFVDLSCEICPMTFVKLKLNLDRIVPGDLMEVVLKEGEHMVNIPRNIKEEGHKIEAVSREGNKYHLLVRKRS
jgi:tRNA 2-thiouridine synthesizing protein A